MSGSKKVFTTLGSSNHVPEEREAFDYYATDPRAVEMLLELEQFSPVIWEPACGEGHISKEVAEIVAVVVTPQEVAERAVFFFERAFAFPHS